MHDTKTGPLDLPGMLGHAEAVARYLRAVVSGRRPEHDTDEVVLLARVLATEVEAITSPSRECPECGGRDGAVTLGREVVCYCLAHKVVWPADDEGTFPAWNDLHEWRDAAELLTGCRFVRGERAGLVLTKDVLDDVIRQLVRHKTDSCLDVVKSHLESTLAHYGEVMDPDTRRRMLAAREALWPDAGPVPPREHVSADPCPF